MIATYRQHILWTQNWGLKLPQLEVPHLVQSGCGKPKNQLQLGLLGNIAALVHEGMVHGCLDSILSPSQVAR